MKILIFFFLSVLEIHSKTLTITNQCNEPVWPVAISDGGTWLLPTNNTGVFVLQTGQSNTISVPPSWSGSIWGRTQCRIEDSGAFHCLTGDCGSHTVGCGGESNMLQPASTTMAAFTLNATDGMDYYGVSFKNGYNLPIVVVPVGRGSTGGHEQEQYCTISGCAVNLISSCPMELRYSEETLGCKSPCQAFLETSFCCTATACSPNRYTEFFKEECPRAKSYANDRTSTFSCPFGQDYVIIFCASTTPTRLTTPDKYTESESDPQGKINYNSTERIKYKIPALISGALVFLGTLFASFWWWFVNGEGSIYCCTWIGQINKS